MSYAFTVREADKAAAKVAIAAKLDEVVAAQPIHAGDRDQAQAVAEMFVDMLGDDDAQDVSVSMSGSIMVRGGDEDDVVFGTGVSVSASVVPRQ